MASDLDLNMKYRNAECRWENPGKSMVECAYIIAKEEMRGAAFKPKAAPQSSAYKAAGPSFLDRLLSGFRKALDDGTGFQKSLDDGTGLRESLENGKVSPSLGNRNIIHF